MKKWIRNLGIATIVMAIIDILLMIYASNIPDGIAALIFILIIVIPTTSLIVGSWLVGFLIFYLKEKNKNAANIISGSCLTIFGTIFLISILGLLKIDPFYMWDFAGGFFWPLQLVIVITFAITTVVINKK